MDVEVDEDDVVGETEGDVQAMDVAAHDAHSGETDAALQEDAEAAAR